ncbi:MAG: bifunctional phosphoglucose/phosphomannose isomerase [Thermoleophilaceae bacterium]
MTELSRERVAAVDPEGMLDTVLSAPLQVGDALWRAESAGAQPVDAPGGLAVCGMGGSAIGADLAAAVIGDRATRPIRTIRGYRIEPWIGPETLVLCASYSGNTEEALAAWQAAGEAGAPRIALTTGGKLAELARAEGVPVMSPPGGFQPRAAVIYMLVGALECAALAGVVPSLRGEIESASGLLETLVEEWGPDAAPESQAKALAARLNGTIAVVHGAGLTAPVARRWKTQINENAKLPAFHSELPEADHNEVCGWDSSEGLAPVSAVFLADPDLNDRERRRIDLTGEIAQRGAVAVEHVETRGETPVERVLSTVLLGDLMSVYTAALRGVDPTPVSAIEDFKLALG